jgi:PRC-barrel domain protein
MTLPTIEEARSWRGLTLVATGEPVGTIDAVYLDRTTRKPEWVLINTGLFGNARTFVPLANAAKVGETVRVPHDPGVVREAPRLALDSDLSESEEARLYSHYGIDYSTAASPSGLPAGAAGGTAGTAPSTGTTGDATAELTPPGAATPSAGTRRLEADTVVVSTGRDAGRSRRPLLAGLGALLLGAAGAGLAMLRARRRKPPSLGDRLAKAGRDAAGTLTRSGGSISRRASLAGSTQAAKQAAAGGRRAARAAAGQAAGGAAAAAGGWRAAWRARGAGREAGKQAASGGRRFTRAAAARGRGAGATAAGAAKAGATAAAAGASKAAAGASKAAARFPTAGGRRMQRLDLGRRGQKKVRKQARQAPPRRRRRSRMKVMGKFGMAVGAAVGYVLGAKAGRERYEQIAASARQLMEKPQVKRVMESAQGNLGVRVEQVADKAADAVHQASDRVGAGTGGTGGGSTTGPRPVPTATGSGADQGSPRGPSGGSTGTGSSGSGRRSGSGSGSGSQDQPKSS